MPPIPLPFSPDAQSLITTLTRRHTHLLDTQIPQLRDCKGPLSLQQCWAEEVREELGVFARQVEMLDATIDDQRTERTRQELRRVVLQFRDSLTNLRTSLRAAILTSKNAIDALKKSNRDELLFHPQLSEKVETDSSTSDDALNSASTSLTTALQRTLSLLQSELSTSTHTAHLLSSSSATLASTSTHHSTLSSSLASTKHLISALEKSDILDRLVLGAALMLFVGVVLLVVKERVVDRGVGWVVWVWRVVFWWTRWVPVFGSAGGKGQLERVGEVAVEKVVGVATTAAETAVGGVVSTAVVVVSSVATASAVMSSVVVSSAVPSEVDVELSKSLSSVLDPVPSLIPTPSETLNSEKPATIRTATEHEEL